MYKCPFCGAIDKYKWDGDPEDDSCRCTECGEWFHACDCEIKGNLLHLELSKNIWVWICLICGKYHVHYTKGCNRSSNFQVKGAMSRHLMTHDSSLVKHGRDATTAIEEYRRKKCQI